LLGLNAKPISATATAAAGPARDRGVVVERRGSGGVDTAIWRPTVLRQSGLVVGRRSVGFYSTVVIAVITEQQRPTPAPNDVMISSAS